MSRVREFTGQIRAIHRGMAGRAVRFAPGVALAAFALLVIPASAAAIPPGPWITPAIDLSVSTESASYPQIAFAPDGSATAVWRYSSGDMTVQATTRPPGGSFGTPIELSASGQSALAPEIAVAPDGTTTVVWCRYNGSDFIVQAATRPPGGSFGAPIDLSAAGGDAQEVGIDTAPDGTTAVVWRQWNGLNYIIQASTRPPGGSFGTPVDISAPGQSAYDPRIAFGPDGTATAVWHRNDGISLVIQAATRPPGGDFATPVDISAPGQNASNAAIEFAPDGSATVTWYRNDGSNLIIQAATRPTGGGFAAAVNLSAPGANATNPGIAVARDGTTIVIWFRNNGTDRIVQATIRLPGGSFAMPTDLSAPGQSATNPQVAFAPDGTATAVWRRANGSNLIVQASTRPPGGGFQAATDLSAAGSDADLPQIGFAPDGTGIGTAVWDRFNGINLGIQSASTATPQLLLGVSKTGSGQGTVTSDVGGINCGVVCAVNLTAYTELILTATPDRGSSFTGWSGGGCSGTATTCRVRMDDVRNVTATFSVPPKPVSPTNTTAVFDGERLHVRLKCGSQYRPKCNMTAVPVTGKGQKGKPMAKPVSRGVKTGKWIQVSFLITPKYRAKVTAMSKESGKTLYVQQKIRSKKIGGKKFKGKKPKVTYHRYRVRTGG